MQYDESTTRKIRVLQIRFDKVSNLQIDGNENSWDVLQWTIHLSYNNWCWHWIQWIAAIFWCITPSLDVCTLTVSVYLAHYLVTCEPHNNPLTTIHRLFSLLLLSILKKELRKNQKCNTKKHIKLTLWWSGISTHNCH